MDRKVFKKIHAFSKFSDRRTMFGKVVQYLLKNSKEIIFNNTAAVDFLTFKLAGTTVALL